MGGGSNTTSVTIPKWLEDAVQENIASAKNVSKIGYTPYYGPDVAAMTPAQIAAMQGTNQMATAFGMPTYDATAGMPAATDYNGMSAYSSGGMYDQALAELKARNPGQYAAITGMFIDPVTGQLASVESGGSSSSTVVGSLKETVAKAVLNTLFGDGPGRAAAMAKSAPALRSMTSGATIGSYMPGGVNTNNPGSIANSTAAALTSLPQSAPTAANRPVTRSSASGGGASGGGGGK